MTAAAMIDLQTAKDQLRIINADSDLRVYRFIDLAQAVLLDYLKVTRESFDVGSPAQTVLPKHIEAALLLILENMWDRPEEDPISPAVVSLLNRSRHPAMA